MKFSQTNIVASLLACAALVPPIVANAAAVTFDFTYSGANLPSWYAGFFGSGVDSADNTATATGSFTVSDASVLNAYTSFNAGSTLTAFTMTVSGSATGNGTFTIANLSEIFPTVFSGNESLGNLNLTTQLVGQSVAGHNPWATLPSSEGTFSPAGDFQLYFTSSPPGEHAPGTFLGSSGGNNYYYSIATGGAQPQEMVLTS